VKTPGKFFYRCGKSDHSNASAGAPTHIQEVGVVTLTPQRVTITEELPGRTTAFRISDVRPQVNGIITKRMFTEGSEVTEANSFIRSIRQAIRQPMTVLRRLWPKRKQL
jgi:multidrug efflux pump subunit AcrA (membrane-fusion protein)